MQIRTRIRRKIVGSDYSAQEPRLTCHLSSSPDMLDAYLTGKDLYAVIASLALGLPYEECLEFYPEGTKLEIDGREVIAGKKTHKNIQGKANRSIGKKLLLASTYGMGAATAGESMGKTAEEGQKLLDDFFKAFPHVKQAIDYSKSSLRERGYVEDWFGRRRHLTDYFLPDYEAKYKSKDKNLDMTFNPLLDCQDRELLDNKLESYLQQARATKGRKELEKLKQKADEEGIMLFSNSGKIAQADRQCFNARIQGGAATLTKIALKNIYYDEELRSYGAHLVASVHDEILVECLDYYNEQVERRLPEVMIGAAKPYMKVPMSCDPYNVQRWYGDELANHILDDYKKLLAKGMSQAEAKRHVINENEEVPAISVLNVLDGKKTVVEWESSDYDIDVTNLIE